MSLENIKIKKLFESPKNILRIFLAFVFLSAGVFRIFNPVIAAAEFSSLKLPAFLSPLMVIFEIGAGVGLLFNKYTRFIYWALIAFVLFALSLALIVNGQGLIVTAGELFIFNLTPTDWFLHFVFLLIAVVLLIKKK